MTQEEGAQWLEAHGWVKIGPDTKASPPPSFAQGWWYEPLDAYMMMYQGRWRVLFLDWVDAAESPHQAIKKAVDSVRNCANIFERMTSDPPTGPGGSPHPHLTHPPSFRVGPKQPPITPQTTPLEQTNLHYPR